MEAYAFIDGASRSSGSAPPPEENDSDLEELEQLKKRKLEILKSIEMPESVSMPSLKYVLCYELMLVIVHRKKVVLVVLWSPLDFFYAYIYVHPTESTSSVRGSLEQQEVGTM